MHRLALIAIVSVACGVAPVQAQTLSLAFHKGDTFKYAYHSTSKQAITGGGVTIPAVDVEITAAETVMVNSVDSTGIADLTLTLSKFAYKSTAAGMTNTTTGLPDFTTEITVAADGRILTLDGKQVPAGNAFLAASGAGGGFFITAVLPSTAVKPGDTWSKDYTQANPGGGGGIKVTTQSKYVRDETLNGVRAAVIETTSRGSIGIGTGGTGGLSMKGTEDSDVTSWIDPGSHRVLKTHSTQTNAGTFDLGSSNNVGGLTGPLAINGSGTIDLTPA